MKIVPTRLMNIGIAVIFASTLIVMANSPIAAHRAGASLQTLRMGYLENNPQWAPTLDPAAVSDQNSSWLTQLMFAELVNLKTVKGKIVLYNDLASRHTMSKNGKTYTFYLRKNARFADGHQVTAQDVVFSIRRALSPKLASPVAYYDSLIDGFTNYSTGKSSSLGVKALNKTTVQIKLSHKAAYFLLAFTYPITMILEKKVLAGKKEDTGGSYMTTTCKAVAASASGPFKPVCVNNSSNDVTSYYHSGTTPTLTLVPNTHFYGAKAHVRLVIPAIPDNQTGYSDFLSGHLDQTWGIPAGDQARWVGKKGAFKYPQSGIEYLGLNVNEKPFSNVHCRLAVAYAIDRETLVKKYLHGTYKSLYSFIPPGLVGYWNAKKQVPHFDPARVRSELAKCPGGIHVTYVYRNDTADRRTEAPAIQAMMARFGIQFKLQGEPRAAWLDTVVHNTPLSKTHTAIAYGDWFMDYPDPQDYLFNLLYSGHYSPGENFSGYNNKQFDRLVDRADVEPNQKKRAALFIQAQKLVLNSGAVVPYDNFTAFDLENTHVHGLSPNLNNAVLWATKNDWSKVSKK